MNKLDVANLKLLHQNNEINSDFFNWILSKKDLPIIMHQQLSVGYPWGEWLRSRELLEVYSNEINLSDLLTEKKEIEVFNAFYFFPNYFCQRAEKFDIQLLGLSLTHLKFLLADARVSRIYLDILKALLEKKIQYPDLTSEKILLVMLASCYHELLSIEDELIFIELLFNANILHDTDGILKIIEHRRNNIKQKREVSNLKTSQNMRWALLISGQFRVSATIIKETIQKFIDYGIDVSEIFVSTWDEMGGYSFSDGQKFKKYLSKELIGRCEKDPSLLTKIMDREKSKQSSKSSNLMMDIQDSIKSFNIPVRIKLNDESLELYSKMSNPEKMYFNNNLWCRELGVDYFLSNFDGIIKIRPDIEVSSLSITEEADILAEEGWIFRYWGFGMGDQFLLGKTKKMLDLLGVHENKMICEITERIMGKNKYWGHVNLGLVAWQNGHSVRKFSSLKCRLVVPPVIYE